MHFDLAHGLLRALVVAALFIALWAVVAGPAFVAKTALHNLGVHRIWGAVSVWTAGQGSVRRVVEDFFERARKSLDAASQHPSIRIALDERHERLREALRRSEEAVRGASQALGGLGGITGPANVQAELTALEQRTKVVEALGVEWDPDLDAKYASQARAWVTLVFVALFAAAFSSVNGVLLNQFFSTLITMRVAGIPVSQIAAVLFVVLELALGFLLALSSPEGRFGPMAWVLMLALGLFAIFESFVLGLVSYNFDLDLPIFDDIPALKLWMGIVGLALVIATSLTGYWLHRMVDQLATARGVGRLKREVSAAADFINGLPRAWENIGRKAREAEAAIESYVAALGGQQGRLSGALDQLRGEREALSEAIRSARVEDWSALAEAAEGDRRGAAAQCVGLLVLTVAAGAAFVIAISFLGMATIGPRVNPLGVLALGFAVAAAFYSVGLLSFGRLRLAEGPSGRTIPTRTGPLELTVAGFIVVFCAVGLLWLSTTVLGAWGVFIGLLLIGVGGLLAIAGYGMERAARGGALVLTIALAVGVMVVSCVFTALRYALVWCIAALAWTVNAALVIAASPVDLLLNVLRKGRSGSAAQAEAPALSAAE